MGLRRREEARDYQLQASDLIVPSPEKAVLLKPGLGKTFIAQDAISRLRPKRTLVVTPAQVANTRVWSREAASWEHLSNLYVTEITGEPKQREMLLMLGADIEVISYENLMWLTDAVDRSRYEAVVYDELQMLKHPGTKRFIRMRHWAKKFPIKLGLTGSPLGNHWLDLWGEMFMVAGEKALGPTKENYIETYFNAVPRGNDRIAYEIRQDGSIDQIRQRIRPYAFSLKPKSVIDQLPKVIPVEIELQAPDKCRRMEAQLRRELEVQLDSGATLTALNNSKLGQAIRQFSSGAVYIDDDHNWEEVHTTKLDALENVVDELQGEPLLVFVWYTDHEWPRIKARFPDAVFMDGSLSIADSWNKKQIPMLVCHPQGAGRGLNLQYGGSSIFWFTLPWSRELFDQGNGREARIGQPDEYVTAFLPLVGPIDKRVWLRVQEKGADEQTLMDAVEVT